MKGRWIVPALAAGVFAVSVFSWNGAAFAEEETISQGVYIGAVDVSGMTADEAESAVNQALAASQGSGFTLKLGDYTITATAEDFGLSWKNTDVVDEAMALGKSGNIIKRYKDAKDLENQTKVYDLAYEADESAVASFVSRIAQQYNQEATEGTLERDENWNLVVVGGADGIAVDEDASVTAIMNYLKENSGASNGEIQLVAEVVKPSLTDDELSKVTDLLGTATTYYGSSYERNTNVEVGASKLNGTILLPGETFSVTEAVAPFTAENGYELAPSYEAGQVVDSYGGGICQVSTTLYNAVLKAELTVVERHNHTMTVSYVDPSKDAAIAEGLMDFRFTNSTDAPIYIEGWGTDGTLTFNIYGQETRSSDRSISFVSETTGTLPSEGVTLVADYDQNVGYLEQTQAGSDGLTAVLWKYITVNGETTVEQVNSSTYQAKIATYKVGVASTDASLTSAMLNAIASSSLEAVQNVINGTSGVETEATETQSSETTASETQTTETPVTDAPVTETPVTDAPVTEAPVTEAPATDAPVTEAPVTEAPAAEDPSGAEVEVLEEF